MEYSSSKTNVYIDGFNLYYGCLKDTCYRWLDVEKLCKLLLPGADIFRIRYFAALIHSRPENPGAPQRQQTYLRALETIPDLSIHYGHYLSNKKRLPLASPPLIGSRTVEVIATEEKGSDVNLATYLLVDGFAGDYDTAIIISNDSDLKLPIEYVRDKGYSVGILNPQQNRSWALYNAVGGAAGFYRPIRKGALSASQFPPTLKDQYGIRTITKPPTW